MNPLFTMFFKEWLLLNENVDANLEKWLGDIVKYAKPEERQVLDSLVRSGQIKTDVPEVLQPYRGSIISVLKEKKLEDPNWFAFSIGYLSAKKYRTEDLEMAVDVAKKLISSGDLPKSRIGARGWLLTGRDIYSKVQEYLDASQRISNRSLRKMRKQGETHTEDEKLIKLVAIDKNLKLYLVGAIPEERTLSGPGGRPMEKEDEELMNARHRILCKYGKGTGWCTASPDGDYHKYYLNNNIYIVHEDDKPVYQFVDCTDPENHQFMDSEDNPVKNIEKKILAFISAHAKVNCYKLHGEGTLFSNLEEYLSSPPGVRDQATADDLEEIFRNEKDKVAAAKALKDRLHILASNQNYNRYTKIKADPEDKKKIFDMIVDATAEKYGDSDPKKWVNKGRYLRAEDNIPVNQEVLAQLVLGSTDREDATKKLAKFMTIYSAGKIMREYKDAARIIIKNNDRLSAFVFLANPHVIYDGMEEDLGRKRIDMMNKFQIVTLLGADPPMRGHQDAYETEDGFTTHMRYLPFNPKVAEILGSENINKLDINLIRSLVYRPVAQNRMPVLEMLRKYKTNMTDEEERFLDRVEAEIKK